MPRKLSTILEKVSYRRIESIIGVSYKVLIRYDEGTSVSEENLKIITETINRVETDPEYKALFYEKPKKEEKVTFAKHVDQIDQQLAQAETGNESEMKKTIKVQNAEVYGKIENPSVFPVDDIKKQMQFVNKETTNMHDVFIGLINSCLDAVHSLNEQLTECIELIVEVTQSIPFEDMISMDKRLKTLEERMELVNFPKNAEDVKLRQTQRETIAVPQNPAIMQNPITPKQAVQIQHVTPQPAPVQQPPVEQRPFINSNSSNLLLSDDVLDLLPS